MTNTNTLALELANAYDMVDRFLRENLDDSDYADYSGALEMIRTGHSPAPAASESPPVAAPAGMEPVARVEIYPLDTDHNYAWRAIPLTDATCMRDGDLLCQMSAQHTGTVELAAPSGPAREPLSQERLQFLSGEYEDIPEEGVAFRDGWRSAEMHHGITAAPKGGQHG